MATSSHYGLKGFPGETYWDFEQYASQRGCPFCYFSEPGLHRSSNSISQKSFRKAVRRHFEDGMELLRKRSELRGEYERRLRSGEIRQLTNLEQLLAISKGNPERNDVLAARRVIEKRRGRLLSKFGNILSLYVRDNL